MNKAKFQRGRNVLATCRCCKKLTHSNLDGIVDIRLCRVCLESAEQENAHNDGAHRTETDCLNNHCPVQAGFSCWHEANTEV